tara:strand:+ start:2006 stop:2959 length:954 start_codon:yes stop_codon:yes gene_type:complete
MVILNFKRIKLFHLLQDNPDKNRKFHLRPTPLAGGPILLTNIIIFFIISFIDESIIANEVIFENKKEFYLFILGALLFFSLGYLDDKFNLRANLKFLILTCLIFTILFFDTSISIETLKLSFINNKILLSNYSIFFTLFCFLVFMNAINMFDGINLQSSLYALIIFSIFLIFYINSLFIKVLIVSFIFYSYLNYRNKSFLGDSGSLLTAFILGYLFIKLYNLEQIDYADEIFIYMMIPGLDMIRLFFKRIFLRRSPFSADRMHLHHLLISKFSNLKTIFLLGSLILFPIFVMLLGFNRLAIIIITIFIYSIVIKKNN